MLRITANEFENNFDYYLEKSQEEDIYITRDGICISVLVNPQNEETKEYFDFVKSNKL